MSHQMVNGSFHNGSVTVTHRMTYRYAVVNPPFSGLHLKPQDERHLAKRKVRWQQRNALLQSSEKRITKKVVGNYETVYTLRKAV